LEFRDTIIGLTIVATGRIMTTAELCEIGREALRLIEEGKVA